MTIAFINTYTDAPPYANAAALAAVVTATYANGTIAEVTNLGVFKLNMASTLTANNTTVISALSGGNWEIFNTTGSMVNNSNVFDPSRIPIGVNNVLPTTIASTGNLTLTPGYNVFQITGSTQINLINSTGFAPWSSVILVFSNTPTVKYNQTFSGNFQTIILAGAADYVAVALSTLTLIWDGTLYWREIGRGLV